MPTMYRIGCFRCHFHNIVAIPPLVVTGVQLLHMLVVNRDDVVFFIFLYQRYIYKMDPTRSMSFLWNLNLQSFLLVLGWTSSASPPRCLRKGRWRAPRIPTRPPQLLKALSLRSNSLFKQRLRSPSKNPRKPKKLTKEVIGLGIFCCSIDLLRQLRLCAVPSVHHIITRV